MPEPAVATPVQTSTVPPAPVTSTPTAPPRTVSDATKVRNIGERFVERVGRMMADQAPAPAAEEPAVKAEPPAPPAEPKPQAAEPPQAAKAEPPAEQAQEQAVAEPPAAQPAAAESEPEAEEQPPTGLTPDGYIDETLMARRFSEVRTALKESGLREKNPELAKAIMAAWQVTQDIRKTGIPVAHLSEYAQLAPTIDDLRAKHQDSELFARIAADYEAGAPDTLGTLTRYLAQTNPRSYQGLTQMLSSPGHLASVVPAAIPRMAQFLTDDAALARLPEPVRARVDDILGSALAEKAKTLGEYMLNGARNDAARLTPEEREFLPDAANLFMKVFEPLFRGAERVKQQMRAPAQQRPSQELEELRQLRAEREQFQRQQQASQLNGALAHAMDMSISAATQATRAYVESNCLPIVAPEDREEAVATLSHAIDAELDADPNINRIANQKIANGEPIEDVVRFFVAQHTSRRQRIGHEIVKRFNDRARRYVSTDIDRNAPPAARRNAERLPKEIPTGPRPFQAPAQESMKLKPEERRDERTALRAIEKRFHERAAALAKR